MGLKNLSHFRCKLIKPCKNLFQIFKFKLRKPLFIRPLPHRPPRKPKTNSSTRKGPRHLSKILSVLCSMDRTTESSDSGQRIAPHPSPLTPAYVRTSAETMRKVGFENDLMEGEGKMRDLVDVEEFLYCWKKLRCPVFMDLVCRFYGELCRDLFSKNEISAKEEYIRYN